MGRLAPLTIEDGFQTYLTTIQRFEPLTRDEERALIDRFYRQGDQDAAHRLVESHLRFVVKLAHSYRGYGLRLSDMVEEGNIGLLEAVRRFDPSRELRFMTYAAYWIRAYMLAHVLKQWSMVGVGSGPLQSKLFFRLARERAHLMAAQAHGATDVDVEAALARKFGTSVERIRAMLGRLEGRDQSLDQAAYRDGETTALELIPDEGEALDEGAARRERERAVRGRLGALTRALSPRERYILEHRLLTDEADTLADIGRHLSLSRERVRQLEERLKGKLRTAMADLDERRAAVG